MTEITIPYHLVIPTILCIASLLIILFARKKLFSDNKTKILWITVIVFLSIYLLIVGCATFDDIFYQWDINRYDLDKDGFFSQNEITKEQEAAMLRLTSDTGRNLSFITGLIFSLIISTGVFFALLSLLKPKKQY